MQAAPLITVAHYWMGRDYKYKADLTPEIIQNAQHWVRCANGLLLRAAKAGVHPGIDRETGNHVASGWRPRGVNDRTQNAGKLSTHIDGRGGDVQDTWPVRPLARWCLANLDALEEEGIWMEDPRWTCTENHDPWVHWQIVPPKSGRRIYIPNMNPPTSPPLD